jgi:hypothetical protein
VSTQASPISNRTFSKAEVRTEVLIYRITGWTITIEFKFAHAPGVHYLISCLKHWILRFLHSRNFHQKRDIREVRGSELTIESEQFIAKLGKPVVKRDDDRRIWNLGIIRYQDFSTTRQFFFHRRIHTNGLFLHPQSHTQPSAKLLTSKTSRRRDRRSTTAHRVRVGRRDLSSLERSSYGTHKSSHHSTLVTAVKRKRQDSSSETYCKKEKRKRNELVASIKLWAWSSIHFW